MGFGSALWKNLLNFRTVFQFARILLFLVEFFWNRKIASWRYSPCVYSYLIYMLNAIVPTNTDRCRREVYTKRMHSPVSSFHLPFDMILVLLSLHEACSLRLCADFTLTHMAENNIYTILKWTHVRWTYDSICWKKWKEKYCRITFAIEIQLCFFFSFFSLKLLE